MDFDRYTAVLLLLRDDAPELDDDAADRLQDAHMDHLAKLHEQGYLVAAGPLRHDRYRGLSILNVDPERALELKATDPAVLAGRYELVAMPWLVPAGGMHFTPTTYPHSQADL